MYLSEISGVAGAAKSAKRVGRGCGSGNGKTSGKGSKGARSRSGFAGKRGFLGGQKPLYRQVAKRGFGRISLTLGVSLDAIERVIASENATRMELERGFGKNLELLRIIGGDWSGRVKRIECRYISEGAKRTLIEVGTELVLI